MLDEILCMVELKQLNILKDNKLLQNIFNIKR